MTAEWFNTPTTSNSTAGLVSVTLTQSASDSDAEIFAQRNEQDVDRDDWMPPVDEPEDGTVEEVQ